MLSMHVTNRQAKAIATMLKIAKELDKYAETYVANIQAGLEQLEPDLLEAAMLCNGNASYWNIVYEARDSRKLITGIETYANSLLQTLTDAKAIVNKPQGSIGAMAQYMVSVNESILSIMVCVNKVRNIQNDIDESGRVDTSNFGEDVLPDDDDYLFGPSPLATTVEVVDEQTGESVTWLDQDSAIYNKLEADGCNILSCASVIENSYLGPLQSQLNYYNNSLNQMIAQAYTRATSEPLRGRHAVR